MNLEKLREYAAEAGHAIGSEVHKFIDWIEGKQAPKEKTVGELQAQQAAAQPAADVAGAGSDSVAGGDAGADDAPNAADSQPGAGGADSQSAV